MKRIFSLILALVAVQVLSLAIDIDLTRTSYYVKVDGTGDGSSWTKAMSPESFAYALPKVGDNVTFYVAEGTYLVPEKSNGNYGYIINSSVSIIGGFPASATNGAVADPKKYKTLFTADPSGDDSYDSNQIVVDISKDDLPCSYVFESTVDSPLNVSGCEFTAGSIMATTLNLEKCSFDFTGSVRAGIPSEGKLTASDCVFRNHPNTNNGAAIFNHQKSVIINNSLFDGQVNSAPMFPNSNYIGVFNSTFRIIESPTSLFYSGEDCLKEGLHLFNNTFYNISRSYYSSSYPIIQSYINENSEVVGNIFVNLTNYTSLYTTSLGVVKHNICHNITGSEDDLVVDKLPTQWIIMSEDDTYAPYASLSTDQLPSGDDILFPLTETTLRVDARGVKRKTNTCAGAFEYPCKSNDVSYEKNTISVDEKFLGKSYAVGVYDNISETVTLENGCEGIVMHTLTVTPSPKQLAYYVKTKSEGKGDGSSWSNAMSGEDFAFVFPYVADGSKFYIAEGEYQPIYNYKGEVPTSDNDRVYYTTKCVSLYGGYPKSSTGTSAVSDPTKYHTIFNGDYAHNNPETLVKEDAYADHRKEDAQYIVRIPTSTSGTIEIKGIEFKNTYQNSSSGSNAINIRATQSAKVICSVSLCTFSNCVGGLDLYDVSSASVKECVFKNNEYVGASVSSFSDEATLHMGKCTFLNNISSQLSVTCPKVTIINSTFIGTDMNGGLSVNTADLMNNTMSGELFINSAKSVNLIGNIIDGEVLGGEQVVHSSYNLYLDVNKDLSFIDETDITATSDGIAALLNSEPSYEGGFTPVIALKTDKLANDESIRFPLSSTIVVDDQRGTQRLESTCMGAYEIPCVNTTSYESHTITVGEKFLGKSYSVGLHEGIVETAIVEGCEVTIIHTLTVLPDPDTKAYYVKTVREGKGDGSSWENAMNGDDFAAYLPLAPDGATFYVAEGRYLPKYGEGLSTNVNSSTLRFEIKSNVTIQGGFPANAETGAKSDCSKYKTLFDGDLLGNDLPNDFYEYADNVHGVIRIDGGLVTISDIYLRGNSHYNYGGIYVAEAAKLNLKNSYFYECETAIVEKGDVEIDNCTFYHNGSASDHGAIFGTGVLHVKNSVFLENSETTSGSAISHMSSDLYVSNCTFFRNSNGTSYGGVMRLGGYARIENSTFFENHDLSLSNYSTEGIYVQDGTCELFNNTILMDDSRSCGIYASGLSTLKLVGNILESTIKPSSSDVKITSDYNLLKTSITESSTDIIAPDLNFKSLVEDVWEDFDGILPTLVLLSDKLPDGTSIRFPLSETMVTDDQRGVERLESTCMGAYELTCSAETTYKKESIIVGKSFLGVAYDRVGIYDDIEETIENENGCQTIVKYTLTVLPDPDTKAYYVKTEREGKGDGSSWTNAMDGDDFAAYLPYVPNGTTFYVAEGTYSPKYGGDLSTPENSVIRYYSIYSGVTIVGGFPKDAKGGEISEPDKYATVFNGDFNDDDVFTESENENGFPIWNVTKVSENADNLFYIYAGADFAVTFDGVTISHAKDAINSYTSSSSKLTLNLKNATLEHCSEYGIYSMGENDLISIENSHFINNVGCLYSNNADLSVKKTSFEKNYGGASIYIPGSWTRKNSISLEEVAVKDCGVSIQTSGDLDINNSVFDSNKTFYGSIIYQTSSSAGESHLSISKSQFIHNENSGIMFMSSAKKIEIEDCLFDDNEAKADLFVISSEQSIFVSDTFSSNKCVALFDDKYSSSFDKCLITDNQASILTNTGGGSSDNPSIVSFSECQITGNFGDGLKPSEDATFKYGAMYLNREISTDAVSFSKTIIKNNKYEGADFMRFENTQFSMTECDVEDNTSRNLLMSISEPAMIAGNSFVNNVCGNNLIDVSQCDASKDQFVNFQNNTVVGNNAGAYIFYGYNSPSKIYNNTILTNKGDYDLRSLQPNIEYVGNVFFANETDAKSYYEVEKFSAFNYNVVPLIKGETAGVSYLILPDETNMLADSKFDEILSDPNIINASDFADVKNYYDEIASLFDADFDKNTGEFKPNVVNNGGLTPTVALRSEALSDGSSIRFPLSATVVDADQRGVSRLDNTCRGAYEMNCESKTTEVDDEIVYGTEFLGEFYSVGIHENIEERRIGSTGCEEIIMHTLTVLPDPDTKGYYVKIESHGKGDGSSWENAMDAKSFATYLPLVADGVTFHVAGGTYMPYYDQSDKLADDNLLYKVNSNVIIIGGYDPEETDEEAKNDPKKFHTVFTTDKSGDDMMSLGTNILNLKDPSDDDVSAKGVGIIYSPNDSHLLIEGVEFRHCEGISGEKSMYLDLIQCTFDGTMGAVRKVGSLYVDNCYFHRVHSGTTPSSVFRDVTDQIVVRNSTFHELANQGSVISGSQGSKISVRSIVIENSTFIDNISSGGALITLLDGKSARINNNTFVNNKAKSGVLNIDVPEVTVRGNIFVENITANEITSINSFFLSYDESTYDMVNNLFDNLEVEGNVKVSGDFDKFIDGTYADGTFKANLKDNGGFTMTVALVDDKLGNGTSITFPLNETSVTKDQRGMIRLESTCMGAYELTCSPAPTEQEVTIAVGESFLDSVYNIPGIYDIVESSEDDYGCKTTVNYTLTVMPDPNQKGFYVKTQSQGKGDGSSWENAMDGKSFAACLSLVSDGVTFHVAEGTYLPYYDKSGKTAEKELLYTVNNDVTIIGGYDPEETDEEAKNDPKKFHTVFTTDKSGDDVMSLQHNLLDLEDPSGDDLSAKDMGIIYSPNESRLMIDGVEFRHCEGIYGEKTMSLDLSRCTFDEMNKPVRKVKNLNVDNCYFHRVDREHTLPASIFGDVINEVVVRNSTFHEVIGSGSLIGNLVKEHTRSLWVENSTFIGNESDGGEMISMGSSKTTIINNTFVNNYASYGIISLMNENSKVNGNIFVANEKINPITSFEDIIITDASSSTYELVNNMFDASGNDDNVTVSGDLDKLLDGKYEDGLFRANLKDNGGFTPTVALLNDKLVDGTSVRFPLTETSVSSDQRGAKRLESTCMGAYELTCSPAPTEQEVIIAVGESFLDSVYNIPGIYDIVESSEDDYGCKTTVNYTLTVMPDPNQKGFYVKTQSQGKGDGSSWENAMDGKSFAACLSLVSDGVTFHVAEGTYLPYYDKSGKTAEKELLYTVNNDVTIIGGYDPEETDEEAKNDPKKFHTVFTTDKSGDDVMSYDESINSLILYDPSGDDVSSYMSIIYVSKESHLVIDGVEFRHCGEIHGESKVVVDLNRCTFERTIEVTSSVKDLHVDNCYFHLVSVGVTPPSMFRDVIGEIVVRNSTFHEVCSSQGTIIGGDRYGAYTQSLVVENSTFVGNKTGSSPLISMTQGTTKSWIYNNTFINNKVGRSILDLSAEDAYIVGNIFIENHDVNRFDDLENAFPETESERITDNLFDDIKYEGNITVSSDLDKLLDGKYEDGLFRANLKDNGGFTPTVALVSDKLSDGSWVRFPKENSVVDYDQRGVERLDLTCYGAYELFDGVRKMKTIDIVDSICLGTDYEKRGLHLETADMKEGEVLPYTYQVRGKIDTDTTYNLSLLVVPFMDIKPEEIMELPTLCHGSGNGGVKFFSSLDRSGSMNVIITDGKGDVLFDDSYGLSCTYYNNALPLGKYKVNLAAQTSCVRDASFDFSVEDRLVMQAKPCDDVLYTTCASNPDGELSIPLVGFHTSAHIFLDNEDISSSKNPHASVVYDENADFTSLATVELSAIPLGEHELTAIDACGNEYRLKQFSVEEIPEYKIDMELTKYSEEPLKCATDLGLAELNVTAHIPVNLKLTSDKGYRSIDNYTEEPKKFTFSDLPAGKYEAVLYKNLNGCDDKKTEYFTITSPDTLTHSIAVNGMDCVSPLSVEVHGGLAPYVYKWRYPDLTEHESYTNTISKATIGTYYCQVTDANGCTTESVPATIKSEEDSLANLELGKVIFKDITCMTGNNGTIIVEIKSKESDYAVTLSVTDKKNNDVTNVTVYKEDENLKIETLAEGSYSYEVYYGTPECPSGSIAKDGNFSIKGKSVSFGFGDPIVSKQKCLSVPDASVSVQTEGWESDYKAEFFNASGVSYDVDVKSSADGKTTLSASGLSGGVYYFKVSDACGETRSTEKIELPSYEPYQLTIDSRTSEPLPCANSMEGEITFTVKGGIPDYSVAAIDGNKCSNTGTITRKSLVPGSYRISYGSQNVKTCPDDFEYEDVVIPGPQPLSVDLELTGLCAESKLIANVSGESAPYEYVWSYGDETVKGGKVMPFELTQGETYTVSVIDANSCENIEKEKRIPTNDELPTLSVDFQPHSESCYKGNNGYIDVSVKLSKALDLSMDVTASCYNLEEGISSKTYRVVPANSDALLSFTDLKPGKYVVEAHLGDPNCTIGDVFSETVVVDELGELKFETEIATTPHTCRKANGTATFDVSGWVDSHSACLNIKKGARCIPYHSFAPTSVKDYVAHFEISDLQAGDYKMVVFDECGTSSVSTSFSIDRKSTFVVTELVDSLTCHNEPNASFKCEIYGWTSSHNATLCVGKGYKCVDLNDKDHIIDKRILDVDGQSVLSFTAVNMPNGSWFINGTNECGEDFFGHQYVCDFTEHEIELLTYLSKLKLDCPYDKDGVITLNAWGGAVKTKFVGYSTSTVSHECVKGSRTLERVVEKKIPTLVPIPDSTKEPIIRYDTTYSGKDMVITEFKDYPQAVDEQGNPLFETVWTIVSETETYTEDIMGICEETKREVIDPTISNVHNKGDIDGSGLYKYENLDAGKYTFVYSSMVEGCTDKDTLNVPIIKPANVTINSDVLSLSCFSFTDGAISILPTRGKAYDSEPFFVQHNKDNNYMVNTLYTNSTDAEGNDIVVTYPVGQDPATYEVDHLYDQSDIKSVEWFYETNGKFESIKPDRPYTTDSTLMIYYKNKDDDTPMDGPVYSNYPLRKFFYDSRGAYFYPNTVTIANLAPGTYQVLLKDGNQCEYKKDFKIVPPENDLRFTSFEYDANKNSYCDPELRRIKAHVAGGWGNYVYSFYDVDAKDEIKGRVSDAYRGGAAAYYDSEKVEGWGLSCLLDAGNYAVSVIDDNGCMIQSEQTFKIVDPFTASIDTVNTLCPEDPTAKAEIKIKDKSRGPFSVKEFLSNCEQDTLDECTDYEKKDLEMGSDYKVELSSQVLGMKTHGLFVYDKNGCGTYVKGVVLDTIPSAKASMKSIKHITCNGEHDGQLEFYVTGGKEPYDFVWNKTWNVQSPEDVRFENVKLSTEEVEIPIYSIDDKQGDDPQIQKYERKYFKLDNLASGEYSFTLIDDNNCKTVFGNPDTWDDHIVIKEPDPLSAHFDASSVCPERSFSSNEQKVFLGKSLGGNVFFQKPTGGTKPYTFQYSVDGNNFEIVDEGENVVNISNASEIQTVYMKVVDANQCSFDGDVQFNNDPIIIETVDFWASTWRNKGDVLALIDVCRPGGDSRFDSVSYDFFLDGEIDPSIEHLDKRMYIYDIDDGLPEFKDKLNGIDTKRLVPDAYFENHFNLLVDPELAKHIQFVRLDDTTKTWVERKNGGNVSNWEDLSPWKSHSVRMRAYFNGCEYHVERNGNDLLKVAYDNDKIYEGGIALRDQIIDMSVSPNPFDADQEVTIKITLSAKVDATLYFYHLNGKMTNHYKINAGQLEEVGYEEYQYEKRFDASQIFGDMKSSDVIVVLLKTPRDASTRMLLFHDSEVDKYSVNKDF